MVVLVVVALLGSLGRARGEKALSAMKLSLSPPSATPICQYYLFTTSIFSYVRGGLGRLGAVISSSFIMILTSTAALADAPMA